MPKRKRWMWRRAFRLALFGLATWGLVSLGRERGTVPGRAGDSSVGRDTDGAAGRPAGPTAAHGPTPAPAPPRRRRRLASSFAFAVLFCAGASFSAIAGDTTVSLLEEDAAELSAAMTVEEPAAEEPAAEEPPVEEAPAEEPQAEEPAPASEPAPVSEPAPAEEPAEAPQDLRASPAGFAPSAPAPAASAPAPKRAPAAARPSPAKPLPAPDPEVEMPGTAATIWLNRTLPAPVPSFRLSPELAKKLRASAREANVDWALLLGVLRADGRPAVPARPARVAEAADLLAGLGARKDDWGAALAFTGRTPAADRAVALAHYFRAIGLRAIVRGLAPEKDALVRRLLADPRVDVYAAGRSDLASGRIDVRVVVLLAYLAETYGQVTVSSLVSGHRLYARPGVVSAHVHGAAVDIVRLGGVPVAGNQQPGGLTERAVRDILLLPTEVRPLQVISLLGLGGPSFPLADHADHIHVGF